MNPSWFVVGLGIFSGFMGGAVFSGSTQVAVGMLAAGIFAVFVGLFVTAPAAKRHIVAFLHSPEPEDVQARADLVMALAGEAALAFDVEQTAPQDAPKPITAIIERAGVGIASALARQRKALEQRVRAEAKEAGYTDEQVEAAVKGEVSGTGYRERWDIVKAAAKKSGRPVPEKLEGTIEGLIAVGETFGSLVDGGGKPGASAPLSKKRPKEHGDGYAW